MMGCYTQINKGSIDGRFSTHAKQAAMYVLDHDFITCVASDAHRPYVRTPWMGGTQEILARRYGEEHMLDLCERNPRRIITGKSVPRHGIQRSRNFDD
jgi:protein-tyrosine phosphatase